MKLERLSLFILCLVICLSSCSKSNDNTNIPVVEPEDRTEQQAKDIVLIEDYLEKHYYNSDDFTGNADASLSSLKITKLEDEETEAPAGHTLLIDELQTATNPNGKLKKHDVIFADTDYEYYVLNLNTGGGDDSPTFADNVTVTYAGFTLDNVVFDNKINPDDKPFDLTSLIPAWRKIIPKFNTAESFVDNGDGTISFLNRGIGVMFVPSGLAYFSVAPVGVGAYSSLIFKFELLQMSQNDHDGDGIPSYLEDINEDGEFTLNTGLDLFDGDDTDQDGELNYVDLDDDGDGILTANEITVTTYNEPTRADVLAIPLEANQELLNKIVKEDNGTFTGTVITFTDSDNDGTPDYLDAQ